MTHQTKSTRPGGRTELNRQAVHQAVIAALHEEGLAFTYTDLAERSGVSRRTIHRRWPDRNDLLLDVLREEYSTFTFEPSGDLALDLREFAFRFRDFSAKPTTILIDGLAALSPDTEFSALSVQTFGESTRSLRESVIEARRARDLPDDGEARLLIQMLTATIATSCSIMRSPLDDASMEHLVRMLHRMALASDD